MSEMNEYIERYKGIHPGKVLQRELEKRKMKQRQLAQEIGEHPQTLNAIIQGKRSVTISMSLKIENKLGMEEGVISILQTYYDIARQKQKMSNSHPDLSLIRPVLFWDTNFDLIDWQKQSQAVIKRVFELGNQAEKAEIIRFYGIDQVKEVLQVAEMMIE